MLLALQVLLDEPRPEDPQDAVVARQMIKSREMFNNTARFWTAVYARKSDPLARKEACFQQFETKITEFKKMMGPGKSAADENILSALSGAGWNLQLALRLLQ